MSRELKDGEPCAHPGCDRHLTHPCEVCGRVGARSSKLAPEVAALDGAIEKWRRIVAGTIVKRDEIDGVCQCGYLTLKPTNTFEARNGGLTVKRSLVRIEREDGSVVKSLRMHRWYSCNACVNRWR